MAGPPKLRELLATLAGRRIDFIVVGGVAAVLEGAGMMTDDLDILVETSEPNVERLLAALDDLDAVYRIGELEIPALELAAVIEAKEAADRPKDRAALPLLRRTLEELRSKRRYQGKPPGK